MLDKFRRLFIFLFGIFWLMSEKFEIHINGQGDY